MSALLESPPTRGAWIETIMPMREMHNLKVAPHAGGVD